MNSSKEISCSQRLIAALAVAVTLCTGGCGDFLSDKTVGAESQSILDDLSKIKTTPEPNIPMPAVYKGPPKIIEQIVGGAPEWKLFYFCRHLSAGELEAIVYKQFATLLFNAKGKSTSVKDYTISSVTATNQLIVRCPTREDVDAVLELLEQVDIQPIQVKIDCIISEVYADKTLDWSTTILIEELLGEDVWAGPTAQPFGASVSDLLTETGTLAAFPGAALRELARAKMGLKLGYWSDKHNFSALVDLLESQGYLKILMNPTLEIVNGKTAKVLSSQHVPLQDVYIRGLSGTQWMESRKEYVDVIDSLEITPHVFADGYIGLETTIKLGSKLTPEGIKQLPIITKKEIENKENRIRPGESLIIGGIRKTEKRDVVRGVPFLKDIPLLGILFSGRDFEERAVETIFILTPSISTGGIPRKEMIEEVKRKQEPASSGGLHKAITNPLDILGKKEQERKALEAEEARIEAEAEKAEARAAVRAADERTKRAEAEAEKATKKAEEATAAEQQAKTEAEKAKTEAKTATEKAAAAEKQAQAEIDKLKAEAEKLKAEAEKAKADAQKATAEAEKAKADAQKATAEAEKAKAEAEKATAEAEKAKAEAEKATANAATTKAEAEKAKAEARAKAKQEAAEEAKEAGKTKTRAEKPKAKADKPEEEAAKKARAKRDKADTERRQKRQKKRQKRQRRKPKRPKEDNKTNELSV